MAKTGVTQGKTKKIDGGSRAAGQQRVRVRVQGLQPLTHWTMASPLRRRVEWRGQASVADSSTMVTSTPLCTTF